MTILRLLPLLMHLLMNIALKGTIVRKLPEQRIRMGLNIFKAIANDGTNNFLVVFFNNYYAFDALNVL